MAIEQIGPIVMGGIERFGLNRHWKPIPLEMEEEGGGGGHNSWTVGTWQDATTKEQNEYLKQSATGNLFQYDTHDWAFAKDIAALVVGKYVYGAACLGHAAEGAWETTKTLHHVWGTYQATKNADGFSLQTFAQNQLVNFNGAGEHFKQAAKYGVVAGALMLDPAIFGLGIFSLGTMRIALVGYAAFNPFGFRSAVHKLDSWCRPENLPMLTIEDLKRLSAWNAVRSVANGSCSLGQILNMHCVGNVSEKDNGSENPRFSLVEPRSRRAQVSSAAAAAPVEEEKEEDEDDKKDV